ncbi:MAG: SPASM domain-containing protein [Oscillospiraceae bacterium]|nr:SPASM domain-containing protein [Oscillospiraceae bacterium]
MNNITHIFNVDENRYALDFRNLFFCLLDDETEQALEVVMSDKSLDETTLDCAQIMDALIKSGYFISKYPDSLVPNYESDILNISFAPVQDCNFACKYCYAKGGEGTSHYKMAYDESKIDKMLTHIYKEKYAKYQSYKFDFVSGGEPLLDFPILEYFLAKIRDLDNQLNKKTTVLVVTNGTLFTEEIIRSLDKHDVFMGISVDGPEEVHNHHRVYKDGGDTYQDVVNGITLLHSMPEISSKLKDAWAMAVITRETGSLVDVMETCISLDFKRMQMQLIRETQEHHLAFTKADLPELKAQYKILFNHIINHAKDGDLSRLKMIANDNDSFGKFLGRLLLRTPVYFRCFAGKNKIAIAASGEIYPCDSFCGLSDYTMSHIDNPELNDLAVINMFENAHVQNRLQCSKCWARNICGGDCYYNSYIVNGNIHEPDPIKCSMNRFFIEHTVDLLIKLQEINPEYLSYLAKMLSLT